MSEAQYGGEREKTQREGGGADSENEGRGGTRRTRRAARAEPRRVRGPGVARAWGMHAPARRPHSPLPLLGKE